MVFLSLSMNVCHPQIAVMLLDRALRLNMDLEEAVRQPEEPMLAVVHSGTLPCSFAKGFSQSTKESVPHTEIP